MILDIPLLKVEEKNVTFCFIIETGFHHGLVVLF